MNEIEYYTEIHPGEDTDVPAGAYRIRLQEGRTYRPRHREGEGIKVTVKNIEYETDEPVATVKSHDECTVEAIIDWHEPKVTEVHPSKFGVLEESNFESPAGEIQFGGALVEYRSAKPRDERTL